MILVMFFISWLLETPWFIGLGLFFIGIVLDCGCWMLGEIIENFFKKLKKGD